MSSVEFTTPFEFIVGVAANPDHGPVGQRSAPVAGVVAAPRFPVLAPTKRLEKPGLAKWVPRPYWDENYCIHAQKIVYIINRYNHIYVCVAICSPSWKKNVYSLQMSSKKRFVRMVLVPKHQSSAGKWKLAKLSLNRTPNSRWSTKYRVLDSFPVNCQLTNSDSSHKTDVTRQVSTTGISSLISTLHPIPIKKKLIIFFPWKKELSG